MTTVLNTVPPVQANYRNSLMQFTNEFNASQPRIVWAPNAALSSAGPAAGNFPIPGQLGSNAYQSRIWMLSATNEDSADAYTLQVGIGQILTLNVNMGTTAISSGTTITRGSGSFLSDGWRVKQRAAILNNSTIANDVTALVSSVTATTLVFPASTFANNDDPFTGNCILLSWLTTVIVPESAGYSATTPAVDLLQQAQWPAGFQQPDRSLLLGQNDVLVALTTTQVASGTILHVIAQGGDY